MKYCIATITFLVAAALVLTSVGCNQGTTPTDATSTSDIALPKIELHGEYVTDDQFGEVHNQIARAYIARRGSQAPNLDRFVENFSGAVNEVLASLGATETIGREDVMEVLRYHNDLITTGVFDFSRLDRNRVNRFLDHMRVHDGYTNEEITGLRELLFSTDDIATLQVRSRDSSPDYRAAVDLFTASTELWSATNIDGTLRPGDNGNGGGGNGGQGGGGNNHGGGEATGFAGRIVDTLLGVKTRRLLGDTLGSILGAASSILFEEMVNGLDDYFFPCAHGPCF